MKKMMMMMIMMEMLNRDEAGEGDRGGGKGWCCTHPHPGYALQ